MQVLINNHLETINKNSLIASGGEGLVFNFKGYALKIYTPDPKLDGVRDKKLKLFFQLNPQLDQNIIKPLKSVFNPQSRLINGFLMNLLSPGCKPIAFLASRDFRQQNKITTKIVSQLFIKVHQLIDCTHNQQMLMMDVNDKNIFINSQDAWLIDVDSYLLPGQPQMYVAVTPDFIDPLVYNSRNNTCVGVGVENDWYSYLVHLFRSLTLVHPFKGTCPGYNTTTERAQTGIPVWHSRVIYPKHALPLDVISDQLFQLFDDWFVKRKREVLGSSAITDYWQDLVECKKCGLWFPSSRRRCSGCQAKAVLAKKLQQKVKGCTSEILLETKGTVLNLKIENDQIKAVVDEKGRVFFLEKTFLGPWRKRKIGKSQIGAEYKILSNKIVVHPDPQTKKLLVYDFEIKKKHKLTTEFFSNQIAVFDTSDQNIYRLARGTVLRGEFKFGTVIEREVVSLPKNQSWFKTGTHTINQSKQEILFGFYRVFREIHWFLTLDNQSFRVEPSALKDKETLREMEVLFGNKFILLLRKTRFLGKEFIKQDVLDYQGKLIKSSFDELSKKPLYENLFGKIFVNNFIFHPTDNGIVKEDLISGQQITFSATENFVQGGDKLFLYDQGILVVKSNKVLYLTLT